MTAKKGAGGRRQRFPKRSTSLLDACQLAYRKHSMGDDSVGWNELSEVLAAALTNEMGDKRFVAWLDKVSTRTRPITE